LHIFFFWKKDNLWIPSPPCIETGHCPEPQKGDGYIGFEERTILNLINQARLGKNFLF